MSNSTSNNQLWMCNGGIRSCAAGRVTTSAGACALPASVRSTAAANGEVPRYTIRMAGDPAEALAVAAVPPLAPLPPIEAEIANHLGYIDTALRDRDYLLGTQLTGADVQLSFVGELAAARFDCSAYPNMIAWVRRFQARPAYQAALERGGPYAFAL